MIPSTNKSPETDARRDAARYEKLLLALDKARDEFRSLREEGFPGIEQAIARLLPYLLGALEAEYALLAEYTLAGRSLKIVASHPNQAWEGFAAQVSERLHPFLQNDKARIFQDPQGDDLQLLDEKPAAMRLDAVLIAPFKASERLYSVWVCNRAGQPDELFLGADRLALESIIDLILRGLQIGEQHRKELKGILEVSKDITASLELEALLELATQRAAEAFNAPSASVMLWDPTEVSLHIESAHGLSEDYRKALRIERWKVEAALDRIGPDERTLVTPDLLETPFAPIELIRREGVRSALSTKLLAGGQWIGILNIYSKGEERRYNDSQRELAEVFANQVAIAIRNAQTRKAEIKGLLATSEVLQAGLDKQATFNMIVNKAREVFQSDAASIFMWDPSREYMSIIATDGFSPEEADKFRLLAPVAESIVQSVGTYLARVMHQKPETPLMHFLTDQDEDFRLALSLPLMIQEKLEGVLILYRKDDAQLFTPGQIELAQVFANQAATAIELVQLHQGISQRNAQLEALNTITTDIAGQLSEEALLKQIVESAMQLVDGDSGGIYLWDVAQDCYILTTLVGIPMESRGQRVPKENGVIGQIYQTGRPYAKNHYQEWPERRTDLDTQRLTAVVGAPIFSGDEFLGAVVVSDTRPGKVFGQEAMDILEHLAPHIAVALKNALDYQAMEASRNSLSALNDIIRTVATEDDPERALALLAEKMAAGLPVAFCHILLYDQARDSLKIAAAQLAPACSHLSWEPKIGHETPGAAIALMIDLMKLPGSRVFRNDEIYEGVDVTQHIQRIVSINAPVSAALIIPLIVEGKRLGLCTLGEISQAAGNLQDERTQRQAESMASQAAMLIQRQQAHQDTSLRLARHERLREIGEQINEILDREQEPKKLYDALAGLACNLANADCVVIYPYDNDLNIYEIKNIGWHGLNNTAKFRAKKRINTSMTHKVMNSGKSVIVDDVDGRWDRDGLIQIMVDRPNKKEEGFIRREGIHSFVGRGLGVKGKMIGTLFINYRSLHRFTNDEISSIDIIANQISIAIQQARLREHIGKHQKVIQAVNRITQMIGRGKDINQVWQAILEHSIAITGADSGRVLVKDPVTGVYLPIADQGYSRRVQDLDPAQLTVCGFLNQKLNRNQKLLIADTEENTSYRCLSRLGTPVRSLLAVRLLPKGEKEPMGAVILESHKPGTFDTYEQDMLVKLSEFGMIAYNVARSYRETQDQARLQHSLLEAGEGILDLQQSEPLVLIANNIYQALNCAIVTLFRYDPDSDLIDLPLYKGVLYHPEKARLAGVIPANSVVRTIFDLGRPYFAADAASDEILGDSEFTHDEKICSTAAIPLLVGSTHLGILFVNYRTRQPFNQKEKDAILLFANQAAQAIYNHTLYQSAEAYSRRLEAVHEAGKIIVAGIGREITDTLQQLLQQAYENSAASGVRPTVVTYHRLEKDTLVLEGVYPESQVSIYTGGLGDRIVVDREAAQGQRIGVTGLAVTQGESVRIGDVRACEDYLLVNPETRSEMAVPLKDGGIILGVLDLESEELHAFREEDELAIASLADLAVIAVKNSDQAEQLRRSSTIALMGAWPAEILHDIKREIGLIRLQTFDLLRRTDLPAEVIGKLNKIDDTAGQLDIPPLPDEAPQLGIAVDVKDAPELDVIIGQEIAQYQKQYRKIQFIEDLNCTAIRAAIDKGWLRRLLRHLLRNAARAFPPEYPNPAIRIHSEYGDQMISVHIQDNGPGVQPEIKKLLFEKPVPHETGRPGMGLMLVKFLAEQYNGDAWMMENEPYPGATFAFSIPIASPKAEASGQARNTGGGE